MVHVRTGSAQLYSSTVVSPKDNFIDIAQTQSRPAHVGMCAKPGHPGGKKFVYLVDLYSAGNFEQLHSVSGVQFRRYFQITMRNAAMGDGPLVFASCTFLTFFVNPNHKFAMKVGEYNPATCGGGDSCVRM